ncbi:phage tail tape measure protein [Salmonella enterica subsp. enterica serovar Minnesota]|uniref:phage tail tape measure protein n=1 Tax=Salmonella enterica TaxID=28901 RepID=UPI0008FD4F37|nr:phage tail tape measure protein [Salmonella enterica]EAA8413830.1 phage tail tape measure protein [Salmonella enterica subsp. enterica serovar Oranienburg]EAM2003891.1 phage tail tape measure protein [Salmonella enterica subsp. enterica serovar Give]EAN3311422.1 phage tail tape measure protein [Salmonella enterica subsp. enterica serovar Give]EAP3744881.1 phage tail tape measure protein [Salmonella enterica subsp. enterica serovar Minnesota]EAP4106307.1 phage tail tape measure protein [Salm
MKNLDIRVSFSAIDKLTRPVETARQSVGSLADSLKKTQADIKSLGTQSRAFSRLRENFTRTTEKIQKTQRTLNGLRQSQQAGNAMTDKQREHIAQLAAKLDRLNEVRTREKEKLREASREMVRHGITLSGSDRTIQSAIRRTEQYTHTLDAERQMLARVTKARAQYDRMQQVAGRLRGGGAVALGAATAAGYGAGQFLAPAVSFDREVSRVGALTRLDKSDPQFAALREQAKKLGAETQFTSRDAASGQAFLAMAGFTPQAIQAALPGVLNMALAGGMDLGESADIGSNILSQFHLDPGEMDRVSDVLTAAFTRTNTDLVNIGEAMKYAGTGMAGLGVSVEQTTAMIGVMANVGLRGSIAGTGLQATFSRLAAPTGKAVSALKELGVSVADATGKMRPAEVVLADIYKSVKKYGDVDQLSLFKDIAGEEAAKSFQALVQSAGSGELQKLLAELKSSRGETAAVAKKMADNLDGDLKNLDSAWEGFRIQIEELVDGALRGLVQGISNIVGAMTAWARENPELTKALLTVGGSALALTAISGGLSLAVGLLLGPVAKLRLGFELLTGTRGLGRAIPLFTQLRAVWGVITGAVSVLGGALSLLLSPVGLIGAAFVAAGVLIWRYWEPIKAFFTGFFSWVWEALTPLRDAFSALSPVFDLIGNGIKSVWNWFTRLLEPATTSKETLEKCASAGKTFGRVLGTALTTLLWPLQQLMIGVGWLLEKLGLIPDGIERAKKQADKARQELEASAAALSQHQLPLGQATVSPAPDGGKPPVITGDNGTLRRLSNIADNTKAIADNTKRIGPGDIVFKNLPRALAVRGAWQESRLAGSRVTVAPQLAPVVAAASRPVVEAIRRPVGGNGGRTAAAAGFDGEIHVHLHNVVTQNPRELARMVGEAVKAEMNKLARTGRASFLDSD